MKIEPGMRFVNWRAKQRYQRLLPPVPAQRHCRNGHNLEEPEAFRVQRYWRAGKTVMKRRCRCCCREAQKKRRQRYADQGRCKNCGRDVVAGRKRCAACLRQRSGAKKRARNREIMRSHVVN
jgi:hypothetical protein